MMPFRVPSIVLAFATLGASVSGQTLAPSSTEPEAWQPINAPLNASPVVAIKQVAHEEMKSPAPSAPTVGVVRLTLDEIKNRVLADNKLLQLAALNVQSKAYATKAVRANYFPQVIGTSVFFHFNDPLGTVLSTPGRVFSPFAIDVPLINQNSQFSTVTAVQPLTDLLKVRQGVKIAAADEKIAQVQMEKGRRDLLSGTEQLFWGLLAAQRIRAGAVAAAAGAEQLAKTGNIDARLALIQGQQGLAAVESQIADLQEQLLILLSLPTCTAMELIEPPLPIVTVKCADEAVDLALANSPEIREAEETIGKADAAVAAGKLDYLPSVAVVGGYANNTMLDPVQQNIGFVGVFGTYTFVDWGKRRNTIREREQLVAMARLKVQQTQDDVRQKTLKAFREYAQTQEAIKLAGQLVEVRKEAEKAATAPAATFAAAKDRMTAEVDYMKADLAHRIAYVKLSALIGGE